MIGKLSAQHRAAGFRDFLDEIDRQTDPALAVHVNQQRRPALHLDQDPGQIIDRVCRYCSRLFEPVH